MSLNVSRTVLRRSAKLPVGRTTARFESTASKATEAAKETASKASQTTKEYTSKASDGLSKVSSTAGPAISGALSSVGNALGKIGGRTGRIIAFVERQIPPTIYYARVGMELSKLVFKGQKMAPPPVSTFQTYFQRALKGVRNPSSLFSSAESAGKAAEKTAQKAAENPESVLSSIRNMDRARLASGAVITAELLGFFTVGEMLGRMKIIGYRGDDHAHH